MPRARPTPLIFLIALALGSIGCSWLSSASRPRLGIENGTTLVVSVFVDGAKVAESQPGSPPEIPVAGLPALPWTVEAKTASGRVLTSFEIAEGHVWTTARPDGGTSSRGAFGRVDLSCGRLTIWAGDIVPSVPRPSRIQVSPATACPKSGRMQARATSRAHVTLRDADSSLPPGHASRKS